VNQELIRKRLLYSTTWPRSCVKKDLPKGLSAFLLRKLDLNWMKKESQ